MLHVDILTGRMAGTNFVIRHFPFRVGRGPNSHLRIEESGVWEDHLTVELAKDLAIQASFAEEALGVVNGEKTGLAKLRNGDTVDLGSVKLLFWFSPPIQASFASREILTFGLVGAVAPR